MVEAMMIEVPVVSTFSMYSYFYAVSGSTFVAGLYSFAIFMGLGYMLYNLWDSIFKFFKGGDSATAQPT